MMKSTTGINQSLDNCYSYKAIQSTVKPVRNNHPWDQEKVVVVPRWSLFRGSTCQINIF